MENPKIRVNLTLQESYEEYVEKLQEQDINAEFCDWDHIYTCCPAVIDTCIGDAEERLWLDECTIQKFVDRALAVKYGG